MGVKVDVGRVASAVSEHSSFLSVKKKTKRKKKSGQDAKPGTHSAECMLILKFPPVLQR